MTTTKAVKVSLLSDHVPGEAFAKASRFREDLFDCLTARGDELFDLTDALLCADGPARAPVDLTLVAEHRRGHGAMYDALNRRNIDVPRLPPVLAGLPIPEAADGRLVLAVDVSNWPRRAAPISADRLFCHVYGRSGWSSDQFVPGWPYFRCRRPPAALRRVRSAERRPPPGRQVELSASVGAGLLARTAG